ncbi:MAG: hypothetical protein QG635_2241 [Bacteroidota bacterium]|nr:hypothetical protein [Bacteroidota bacterium]
MKRNVILILSLLILLALDSCQDSLGIESKYRKTLIKAIPVIDSVPPNPPPPPPPARFEYDWAYFHFKEYDTLGGANPKPFINQWDTVIHRRIGDLNTKIVIDTTFQNWVVWLAFNFEFPLNDQFQFDKNYRKDYVKNLKIRLDSAVLLKELQRFKRIILDGTEDSSDWAYIKMRLPNNKYQEFTRDSNLSVTLYREIYTGNTFPFDYGKECIHGLFKADFRLTSKIHTTDFIMDFIIFF